MDMNWNRIAASVVLAGVVGCSFVSVEAEGQVREGAPARELNRYGAPVIGPTGARIRYSQGELQAQADAASRNGTPDPTIPAKTADVPAGSPFSASPSWSYATLGSGIGWGAILVAQNGPHREIYTTAYQNNYWVALRYDAASEAYDEVFVSPIYGEALFEEPQVNSLTLANVAGGPENEIVVALSNGHVVYHDLSTKAVVGSIDTAVVGFWNLVVADVDNDGQNELVACGTSGISVVSLTGVLEWTVPAAVGGDVVVAQMDNDPALEIAVTGGHVVDCATHAIQWSWPNQFGFDVEAADIDGDGRSELVVASTFSGYMIFAYDVERQLPKWSLAANLDYGGVTLADTDGDSVPEIVYGENQWGDVLVFDAVTLQPEGNIENPDHGVTNVTVGDADGDGDLDVLWGAGASSSGSDYLFVADWATKAISWQNVDLVGPFIGPVLGDLDGNGTNELVIVSSESNSSYSSGRILVFDARARRLLCMSSYIADGAFGSAQDVRLRNVDADPGLEILVAADAYYDGSLEVYDFDGSTNEIHKIFGGYLSGTPVFTTIEAGDIDNDGQMEILGCGEGRVYVYDFATSAVEWISLSMGFANSAGLEVSDLDEDGALDIIAVTSQSDIYVFNGVTKALDAVLFGPFTALALGTSSTGAPAFVAGNLAGELVTFAYTPEPDPYPYVEVGRQQFGAGRVDGITYDSNGRIWIGSNGTLKAFDSAATPLWSASGFGQTFGRKVAFLPHSNIFFAATAVGAVQFQTGTGFGQRHLGVYSPSTGTFFERNSHTPGPADAAFSYGPGGAGFVALAGDWDGNGIESPGLYDPVSGVFFLRNSNSPGSADVTFGFGPATAGWTPLVGDWNGDGVDTIGLFNPVTGTFFLRNSNSAGVAHLTFGFGPAGVGWQPIAGDWNGDGVDTIGLHRAQSSFFFLRNSNTSGPADLTFGYGAGGSGWVPIVGDWNGDGADSVGLFDAATANFFLRNSNSPGGADTIVGFGPPGMIPVVGSWTGH